MIDPRPEPTTLQIAAAPVIAFAFIALCSLFKEPNRRNFSAIVLAGAGAAYLSGGFGAWELAFCALVAFIAFGGLNDYRLIGAGWILHTLWDVLHHLYGNSIVPFVPTSSVGCAICDPILAIWYFLGAPSLLCGLRRPRAS
jgi:Family of unknown function (DUF6010)